MWPWRKDRIGPIARNGKNVNTTRINVLPTSTMENVMLSVFNPTSACLFLPIIDPERASSMMIGAYRPANITRPVEMLKNSVFPDAPRKSEPLFAAADVNSYRICVKPVELPLTPIALAAPVEYASTVGIRIMIG